MHRGNSTKFDLVKPSQETTYIEPVVGALTELAFKTDAWMKQNANELLANFYVEIEKAGTSKNEV